MPTNNLVRLDDFEPKTLALTIPGCVPLPKVDERYFAFANSLESPLNTLALDQSLFMGKGHSIACTSLKDVHPLATSLPWLFAQAFPTLSEAEILDISEASTLLIMAVLLQDPYLDGQLPPYPGIPLLHEHLHTAALQKFFQLFDSQSSFWTYFKRYFFQYTTALTEERIHVGRMADYSLQQAYEIGSGKMALHKATTTAMALKAGAEGHIPILENALDALYAAMQLADDIADWKEDYERNRYTLPLTWVISSHFWPLPSLTLTEINERFEASLILEILVKQAIEWFQQAKDIVADMSCANWNNYVDNYQTITRAYQQSLVAKKVLKIMSS
jgi:hypothetical protein